MKKQNRNLWIWTSVFFAFFAAYPGLIDHGVKSVALRFGMYAILVALVLYPLFRFGPNLKSWLLGQRWFKSLFLYKGNRTVNRAVFWGIFALYVIVWTGVLFVLYPGTFGADAPIQLGMFNGDRAFTTHHPWLHTLIVGGMINGANALFGNADIGVFLYILIFQICFCAWAIASSLSYLNEKGLSPIVTILMAIIMVCSPLNMVLVCYTTKDIVFAPALLMFILAVCRLLYPADTKANSAKTARNTLIGRTAAIVFWGVVMCMLRNQGLYMVAAALVVFAFVFLRQYRKARIRAFMLSQVLVLVLGWVMTSAIPSAVGIKISNPREMLPVPIQQIAYILNHSDNAEEKFVDEKLYDEALEWFDGFTPDKIDKFSADNAKDVFKNEKFTENPMAFVQMYLKFLSLDLGGAIQAYAHLTAPYLDMRVSPYTPLAFMTSYDDYAKAHGITTTDRKQSKAFEWLHHTMFSTWPTQNCPLYLRFYDPGLVLYLLIFMLGWCMFRKSPFVLSVSLFTILYVLTMLLGPVSLLRYSFVYAIQWPFLSGALLLDLFRPKKTSSKRTKRKAEKKYDNDVEDAGTLASIES